MKNETKKSVNNAIVISLIILALILIAGLSFGQEIHPDLSTIEKSETLRSNWTYCVVIIFVIVGFLGFMYRITKLVKPESRK